MPQSALQSAWRFLHGLAFALLLISALAVPLFRRWPWVWLVPLVGYFVLVACVPPLRRTLSWRRVGWLSAGSIIATLGIMTLTTLVLVTFQVTVRPNLSSCREVLPLKSLGGVVMAGAIFTVVNATLEELVFRGVLFDAIESQWGVGVTLVATTALFGLGHLEGYPPGPIGACLAGVFGLLLGALRHWTGGLLLPIIAHMGADATIYGILLHAGAL